MSGDGPMVSKRRAMVDRLRAYRSEPWKLLRKGTRRLIHRLNVLEELRARRLTRASRVFPGHQRVYHIHIRKTGGTSLNRMLMASVGGSPSQTYERLVHSPGHRVIQHGRVIVGWNRRLIEEGNYHFAFSHIPVHELDLPSQTFTVTCLRNPITRVVSHYRMLLELSESKSSHPALRKEGHWLGQGFDEFLDSIPEAHLKRQLYMFSPQFDVGDAFARIEQCSHVMLLEALDDGLAGLAQKLELQGLPPQHARATRHPFEPSPAQVQRLRTMLAKEIELYNRVCCLLEHPEFQLL